MKKRRVIQSVLFTMIGLTGIGGVVCCLMLEPEKPWMKIYITCCCGVLIANLIFILILARKNIK